MFLECPQCHKDIPSEDLARFVRFYDGDEGYERCPHCSLLIFWKMQVAEDITRLEYKELLLRQGRLEAEYSQFLKEWEIQ